MNIIHALRISSGLFTILVSLFLTTPNLADVMASDEAKRVEPVTVNVLNYVRAKSSLHFDGVIKRSGGVNQWTHGRLPVPLDKQRIERMNRDTLYSSAVLDIREGATLTLPDAGARYLSATVVNQDHYINRIYHAPGQHELSIEEFDTPYVLLTIRILVDETDPADLQQAHALQDALQINSQSALPYTHPKYDLDSLTATSQTLLKLAANLTDATHSFGKKDHVNPIKHLLVTAYGWGGLPETEAFYENIQPNLPLGHYTLTVGKVPVNGFWSISVYNQDGYFQENEYGIYSTNNLIATANPDGTTTLHFGGDPTRDNFLPITEGWNYVVRMYQPQASVLKGEWRFPTLAANP